MEGLVSVHPGPLDVRGKRVLITGHTGFKGAWLAEWLLSAGASVTGIALAPESPDALFNTLALADRMDHVVCDIRNRERLTTAVRRADPELVFHLAAQALVRRSYREPVLTWETNVTGTLNVLEALRALKRRIAVVAVTTDKVYRNHDWEYAYRETDELGGRDPYSASKAGCEIAVASWRTSFGSAEGIVVATARAGNVLGGGDTSDDRIVPDCFRAWSKGVEVELRHPASTRPWQHVLEPLSGYVALASHLQSSAAPMDSCNFGPGAEGDSTVKELVARLAAMAPGRQWRVGASPPEHEARALSLSIDRARHRLGWHPRLAFEETMSWTNEGYVAGDRLADVVRRQIRNYEARASTPVFASLHAES